MKKSLRLFLLFMLLLSLAVMPLLAAAMAEFSADMTITDGKEVTKGKIYVKPNKMRQEIISEDGTAVTILRMDKKVAWTLMPDLGSYMEVPLDFDPNGPQAEAGKYETVNVGTETIGGYHCEIVKYVYKDKKLGNTIIWQAKELGGFGIKIENYNSKGKLETTTTFTNIKAEKQPDELFELPEGYSKFMSIFGFGKP
ncbi:MAG TPA: hypothetical protein DCY84_00825 [Firmicutes bacterium]|nr:hypothetical protein [Bacillota bacterium]HAZ20892.1 hypothetical protein [Bacillota bacterium]HBG43734.1 hypothetical protein [Bacillota bacterium]HBL68767.1 hypothetical protein [Bacillota bacterium]HBR25158.1 hypothetical protein [Bacillota bacterium]